jgi:hypothetical protein
MTDNQPMRSQTTIVQHGRTTCKTRPEAQQRALLLVSDIQDFMMDANEFLGGASFLHLKAIVRELQDIANGIR